jgi:hypothetical protein
MIPVKDYTVFEQYVHRRLQQADAGLIRRENGW